MGLRPLSAVAVTGGCGALGERLVAKLADYGVPRIVVFDRVIGKRPPVKAVSYYEGNILAAADMQRAFAGCDTVFHLAALAHAGNSASDPERYHEINVIGTECVMAACVSAGVQRLVFTSTGHVYGVPEQSPIAETHPARPLSVYAQSKLDGEGVIQKHAAQLPDGACIARLTNVYGGGIGAETVIGKALSQAAAGHDIALRNLSEIRDFIHIDDAAEGLIRLARMPLRMEARILSISAAERVFCCRSWQGLLHIYPG